MALALDLPVVVGRDVRNLPDECLLEVSSAEVRR
jgi:hypothetical protein